MVHMDLIHKMKYIPPSEVPVDDVTIDPLTQIVVLVVLLLFLITSMYAVWEKIREAQEEEEKEKEKTRNRRKK